MLETRENSKKPPFFRDTRKYCERREPAESSQDEKPRNTTSLSTSSLMRPEANLPPQFLASPATMAAVTSIPFMPSRGGMIRTVPAASSDRQAAPLAAIA